MKRLMCIFLIAFFSISLPVNSDNSVYAEEKNVSTSAGGAVLYCVNNGEVIYEFNENTPMKMASTTKLMTTLITLEYAKKDNKIITFNQSMVEEGSSMYLKLGERVYLKDLCIGMMLPSGNDAATAAAVTIAGSKEKFAVLMNRRAKEIGMKNSHFVTPSGLDDENHYSSAYDMALLMAECLKNKEFREISGSTTKTVSFVKPNDKTVTYNNHNRLLSQYKYCISGKTGYTMAAGRCLVTAAEKDGITLVAVTLNDKNDWNDHISLYEYGFSCLNSKQFRERTICQKLVGGYDDSVNIKIPGKTFIINDDEGDIKEKIMLAPFAYAPVKKGDKAGMVLYLRGNKIIDKKSLVYADSAEYKEEKKGFFAFIKGLFS